jgi:hypothetical protein
MIKLILTEIREGANKSLAWPTSRCQTESSVGNSDLFMCWISGLFLLQRLRRSISGDACNFNIKTRAVIEFFFLQGKAPKEIQAILIEILGEHAPSYATAKNWVAQLKCGDFSTCDAVSWTTQHTEHPGDYWSNSRANLGSPKAGIRLN